LVASKKPIGPLSGHAFAVARITDIHLMTKKHEEAACCEVYPRAWAWRLEEIRPIKPIKRTGALGLYNVVGLPEDFE
jgi:hypothetical protein